MKYLSLNCTIFFFILCSLVSISFASIELETTPGWISSDDYYSTGAGWGDIDGNGWLDFVVSNGNDMSQDPEEVYFNSGGLLSNSPAWLSADVDYSGHLSLGDIDADGDLDLAVAGFISNSSFAPYVCKLYRNNSGTLESTPSWVTADTNNTFYVAFGDVDGDGDLDLATANGESYYGSPQANEVYYNNGSSLETFPTWVSTDIDHTFCVAWADLDNDGDLDLAAANSGAPTRVYYNNSSGLENSASWSSTEVDNSNSLAWGDVNGDGWLDLAVNNNTQLNIRDRFAAKSKGSGRIRIYINYSGTLETTASWTSSEYGYGSAVAWADLDYDGDYDLAAGEWWGGCRIYENLGGFLENPATWHNSSGYDSVVEAIVFADVDGDGRHTVLSETISGNGAKKVFYLDHWPAESIDRVAVEGTDLLLSEYCYDLQHGWIALAFAPPIGTNNIEIDYVWSHDLDMGVSNWDPDIGNFVFFNGWVPVEIFEFSATP